MPNQPKTPNRNFRATTEEWEAWAKAAAAQGLTRTDFIRKTVNAAVQRQANREKKTRESNRISD